MCVCLSLNPRHRSPLATVLSSFLFWFSFSNPICLFLYHALCKGTLWESEQLTNTTTHTGCACSRTDINVHARASPETLHFTTGFAETSDGNKRFLFSLALSAPHTNTCTHTHMRAHTSTLTCKSSSKCSIFSHNVVIYERCFSQQADSSVWNASFHQSTVFSSLISLQLLLRFLVFPLLSLVQDSLTLC